MTVTGNQIIQKIKKYILFLLRKDCIHKKGGEKLKGDCHGILKVLKYA